MKKVPHYALAKMLAAQTALVRGNEAESEGSSRS